MSLLILEVIFALMALGGFITLVYGIRLKPDASAAENDAGEEILIDFPCRSDESSGFFEPGPPESIERDEKKEFDPEKHQPEVIGGQKKD